MQLRHINAPDMAEEGGPEAIRELEKLMLDKRVELTIYARDRYGRIIADVGVVQGD